MHYSDDWQPIIDTGTTIATFLMVFLIQNTQNRNVKALHLKLDKLIRSGEGARNRLVNLEKLSDEELMNLEEEFHRLAHRGHPKSHEEAKETREDRKKSKARRFQCGMRS